MATKTPTVLTTAFGQYTVTRQLGEGGSGRVFAVVDEAQQPFAIKLLDPDKATTDRLRRFKNEIFFGRTIAHPHIVPTLDSGVVSIGSRTAPFFVMPFYGSTLRSALKSGLSVDTAIRYFGQMLDGLEAAHLLNVWHRDVKPENILIDTKGTTIVIADFGIARLAPLFQETAVKTQPHTRLANFTYAAPEQRTGGTVDSRADIFALGLILNEMMTGTVPHGTGYALIANRYPNYAYLDELVARMLANRPEDRPGSIDEIKKELLKRHNDFISRQKVDGLRKVVVPATTVSDPIATDPIRVVGGEWDGNRVVFVLNREPPARWQELCRNAPLSHYMNYPPRLIEFAGKSAGWRSDMSVAQQMIDQFKERVVFANREYVRILEADARERERAERQRLQDEAAAEERRRAINAKLQF